MNDKTSEGLPIGESEPRKLMVALAVDDSESVRTTWELVRLRHFANRNVLVIVGTANDAMDKIKSGEFDFNVIFTDFDLGGEVNGMDLIKEAKSRKPGIVSVLVSSHGEVIAREDGGADFYLGKPFTLKEIDETLGKVKEKISVSQSTGQ